MSSYASFGFSGAIAKPFRMDEIEQLLRSLVQG
jgi:CO/xanthine dehydrogenase FAD-binding subunit